MDELLEKLPGKSRKKLKKKKQPEWTKPMLAKLSHEIFSDEDWIYERKLDGERCLVFRKGKDIRIMSRNKKVLNKTYPDIIDAFKKQKLNNNFIIDGEMVAFEGKVTSFSKLQNRMHLKNEDEARKSKTKVYFYVFDVLFFNGYDLTSLRLIDRKKILKKLLNFKDPVRFTQHRNKNGKKYHSEACKKGWEGIIAKKRDSKYSHSRSSNWLKLKCVHQQEFVIGGYTDPQGERVGFGALLIGFYKNDKLKYAGKVGTGYDDETLKKLKKKLSKLEVDESEFDGKKDLPSKIVNWVKPKLVAEVGFTEWTNENKLRHPRYLGLRRDKKPKKVKKES